MSRSRPNANENPSTRWFDWAGAKEDGFVQFYDKENKQNIAVKMPFRFLPLDAVSCITGYNRADDTGIYSNEVRNTNEQKLIVKTTQGRLIAEGLWNNIKGEVASAGGKFTQSVYIAFYDEDGNLQIGNIKFRGASLGQWIDLRKKHGKDVFQYGVSIYDKEFDKNGKVEFAKPLMKLIKVSDEGQEESYKMDTTVQQYLDSVIGKAITDHAENETSYDQPTEDHSSDQPKANDSPHPNSPAGMAIDDTFDDMDDDLPF